MDLVAKAELKIGKPASEVFDAIVDPVKMANYFISRGSGRLESGKRVQWSWADVGAEMTIEAREVIADERISFSWPATGSSTLVDITLDRTADGATLVNVSEASWPGDEKGIASYGQQVGGWVHMLLCLKGYLEHGINLRR